jgi:predicted Zn-dependent protease
MSIKPVFLGLTEELAQACHADEQIHVCLFGEDSDFIRFNHNRIRQVGKVSQYELQIALVSGRRHCIGSCDLTGHTDPDRATLFALLEQLRRRMPACPEDPYLHYNLKPISTESEYSGECPDALTVTDTIMKHADGLDLVGHYAGGNIVRAFGNSLGQHNWHHRQIFNFDWSCHEQADKAVKSCYAGSKWQDSELSKRMEQQRYWLEIMQRPAKRLSPGRYRAYLAPAALAEIMFLLAWDGFSLRALRTRHSPLLKLAEGQCVLNEKINIMEERRGGLSPVFSNTGFMLPETIDLVRGGHAVGYLVDARSSLEYQQEVNTDVEQPEAIAMSSGELSADNILAALDTGLYISNLWYGNFSDRNTCRMTGMTRYACLWVEHGEIQAPVEVMRFDDSVYRMLGDNLIGLTLEREFIHDPHTYERRSLSSMYLPGALIENFTLTL